MYNFGMILGVLIAACSAFAINSLLRRQAIQIPLSFRYLFWFLPFLAGGFHTYMAAITVIILSAELFRLLSASQYLNIGICISTFACVAIVLGYCITPVWAADRGMAVWGILRYCPVLLLSILLMQYPNGQKNQIFTLIPLCGAVMTVTGCILWCIPATREFVAVNGRLSGFLQYPNTFAAFLLTGIAVLGTKQYPRKVSLLWAFILIVGIFLSGSRTGVLLLVFLLLSLFLLQKKKTAAISLILSAAGIVFAFCLIKSGDQITFLGRDIGSLFLRILYYKDAVPVILKHPFGLGYLGYRALETTFQTSRYTVSFVHSGLLQLLLDIGWIPTLLFAAAVIQNLRSPKTEPVSKMVLLVLSAHALIDFDFQFFLFWAVCLLCMDFESGKMYKLKVPKFAIAGAVVPLLVLCVWLGFSDWLCRTGDYEKALKMTPFHTDALTSAIMSEEDPEDLDRLADKILSLNPTHALACSAKANAAYARGQIPEMIRYKEKAIQLTPYTTEEYCDYIEKLYTVLELYVRKGDTESAAYCLKKLLSIPDMMEAVSGKTDPLAYKTGNSTELVLPEAYQKLILELAKANPDY